MSSITILIVARGAMAADQRIRFVDTSGLAPGAFILMNKFVPPPLYEQLQSGSDPEVSPRITEENQGVIVLRKFEKTETMTI